jgi:hypothetical protein
MMARRALQVPEDADYIDLLFSMACSFAAWKVVQRVFHLRAPYGSGALDLMSSIGCGVLG